MLKRVDQGEVDAVLGVLRDVRERGGRLFLCGNGGGAGHASHATCDFRKVAGFEAYCVNDNVSELTARINDDSWVESYYGWLLGSNIRARDALFVFSVGGGVPFGTSDNLCAALTAADIGKAAKVGIVGKEGGAVKDRATACIRIPSASTPVVEGIQAVLWHLLVTELAP